MRLKAKLGVLNNAVLHNYKYMPTKVHVLPEKVQQQHQENL